MCCRANLLQAAGASGGACLLVATGSSTDRTPRVEFCACRVFVTLLALLELGVCLLNKLACLIWLAKNHDGLRSLLLRGALPGMQSCVTQKGTPVRTTARQPALPQLKVAKPSSNRRCDYSSCWCLRRRLSDNKACSFTMLPSTATQSAGKLYYGSQYRDTTGIDLLLSNYNCAVADNTQLSAPAVRRHATVCVYINTTYKRLSMLLFASGTAVRHLFVQAN